MPVACGSDADCDADEVCTDGTCADNGLCEDEDEDEDEVEDTSGVCSAAAAIDDTCEAQYAAMVQPSGHFAGLAGLVDRVEHGTLRGLLTGDLDDACEALFGGVRPERHRRRGLRSRER